MTTPPRVEHLRVRNYRVLHDLHFKSLSPLTAILGANGSGKSTLFDVFSFLADCLGEGLRRAVDKRGRGLKDLRSRGHTGPIAFELGFREYPDEKPKSPLITYILEIDADLNGPPVVTKEIMRWKRGSHGRPFHILDYARGEGSVVSGEVPEHEDQRQPVPLTGPDVLAVSTLGQLAANPRVQALRNFITGWHLSYLTASAMRDMPPAGPIERLSRSGDNLANVLQHLSERHPAVLEQVFDALRHRVPRLEKVEPRILDSGHLLLLLKDAPFTEDIQARYVSEGTLKLLAYLVQLYDPTPPPLIGIEEPENFLHPRLLQGLAEECEQRSIAMQLVVTTHSPFFINGLSPEQVWILGRNDRGYTEAHRAADFAEIPDLIAEGARLGDLWMEGYLQPGMN